MARNPRVIVIDQDQVARSEVQKMLALSGFAVLGEAGYGIEAVYLAKETAPEVCFTCHKMKKMQFQKSSHMPLMEGKIACVDCHNPHGSPNPGLLIENSVNENCTKCHSEKAGPMLW